jgi:hypothetical protein
MNTRTERRGITLPHLIAIASVLMLPAAFATSLTSIHQSTLQCNEAEGAFCAEQFDIPGYEYVGHDADPHNSH